MKWHCHVDPGLSVSVMVQSHISYIAILSSSVLRYDRVGLLGFLKVGITQPCGLWLSGFTELWADGVLASADTMTVFVCSVIMPTPLADAAHAVLTGSLPSGVMANQPSKP